MVPPERVLQSWRAQGVCAHCAAGCQQFVLSNCLALQSSTGKNANLTFEFTVLFFSWEMSLRASSWDCLVWGREWASAASALSTGMHPARPQHGKVGPPGSLWCSLQAGITALWLHWEFTCSALLSAEAAPHQ